MCRSKLECKGDVMKNMYYECHTLQWLIINWELIIWKVFNPSSFGNIFEDTVVDDLYWIKSHASIYCNISEPS